MFWTNIIYILFFYSLFKDAVIAQIVHRRMVVHKKIANALDGKVRSLIWKSQSMQAASRKQIESAPPSPPPSRVISTEVTQIMIWLSNRLIYHAVGHGEFFTAVRSLPRIRTS